MYFKLSYTVRDLILEKDENIVFEINKPRHIKIQINRPSEKEMKKGHLKSNIFCDIFTEDEPNEKNLGIFNKIETNTILEKGSDERIILEYTFDNHRICLPDIKEFPEYFRSYIKKINDDLTWAGKNVVGLIRWINNIPGKHNPFSHRGVYWSKDRIFWHPLPLGFSVFIDITQSIKLNNEQLALIHKLNEHDLCEPVYHELFREAWNQRVNNPRSALIMGIAAAEVGVKLSIIRLVPDTKWLVENLLIPPLHVLLKDYWPSVPVKNKINNNVLIPESLIQLVKKGVAIRNKIVHVGDYPPETKKVEEILDGIKDLLFLLDYYSGFNFSFTFISSKVLAELNKR